MFNSFWPHGLYNPWNSPSPNTGVGSCSLLQRISLTKESNQGLLHCRWLLYKLCYQGSPAKLGVVSKSMEKAMAPHSSTLAWKTLWTEEPCRLRSMGSLRVRHDWATSLSLFTFLHWRRKWQPTPVFLSGESQDGGAWWAAVYGVSQSQTQLMRQQQQQSRSIIFPWSND